MAWKKEICTALLFLLACVSTIAVITACEPDYQKAGRRTGELYNEAGTVVVLEPTARAERLATDAAQAGEAAATAAAKARERAPTVAVKVEERAPTVAAEAAEAVREYSEGFRETEACGGAAMLLACCVVIAAVLPRRHG
jgi:hypothetical protein